MAVDEMVKKMADAWNVGDSVRYAALFSADATFVDVLGRLQAGRKTIAIEHQSSSTPSTGAVASVLQSRRSGLSAPT